MADVIQTANTDTTKTLVRPVIDDVIKAEKHITALIAVYKATGVSGVAALLPALEPEVMQDYQDVKAALPTIKAGYKTTEFWIVVATCTGLGILTAMGKVPAVDGATIIGALTGIYAVVRGLIKK